MASGSEEDVVVLVLTEPSDVAAEGDAHGEEDDREEIAISTSEIHSWDISRILRTPVVKVRASRGKLIQESSYFRSLLCGSFSESGLSHVSIQCDIRVVTSVLQCVWGCPVDVSPKNFLLLLEGALFFGVEVLLLKCKAWFQKTTSARGAHSIQVSLDTVIEIWNYSSEHGVNFVSETCTPYLARNFVWMITCSSFADVPYDLLYSCLEHPDLTVYSEKQLCEALLFWITSNEKSSECSCDTAKDYVSILEKVRVLLLPLGYSAGKRRSCYFSGISNESISAIFDLMKEFPEKLFSAIAADGSDNMKIRLTQYSEKVDLAGCAHFTGDLLYLAVLPINSESLCRKRTVRTLVEFKNQHGDNCHTLEKLPTTLSFKAVTEVDMSKCPKMHFGAVINFLHLSFPSLQKLNLSYCTHFKIEGLFSLIQNCPLIDDIDLTVDISPVIRSQVSISSASSEVHQAFEGSPYSTLQHVSVVSNITKLSFEGRTDLDDSGLLNISGLSGSLCYLNLKGCSTVTDVGISKLIQECINIQSIIVSYTSFGMNSILVLCSEKEFPNTSFVVHDNYEYSSTIAFRLRELHMDGCRGIEARHMKRLMRCLFMLRSLSLQETSLADDSLSEYRGFLLEKLDVSETLVSCAAVCHVVRKNPGIRMLKVISCRNLYDIEGIRFNGDASCKDLYGELNQKCLLEEVAFGWGFTSSSIMKIKHAIRGVRAMSVGLGASLDVSILSEICPFIETLVLKFQVISDSDLISILKSLSHLKVLDLCCCLGDLTSKSFQIRMINLKSLRLERVTPWMTNEDLIILTEHCLNLTELSLSGCKLLNSDAQQIISSGWPGLTIIHLEDCGNITFAGVSFLLDCVAIEDLLLRHNGRGIRRNIISDAALKLPLLRKIALDTCDACEGGFDSPSYTEKYFLSIVKISRCKRQRCNFELQKTFRPVHKDTMVQVSNSKELRTTYVKERV